MRLFDWYGVFRIIRVANPNGDNGKALVRLVGLRMSHA